MTSLRTELERKALHISMGGFALALANLTWPQAALCALTAFAFNLLVLPRIAGRRFLRSRDIDRGFPAGILIYPLTVLCLILIFRQNLALAAAGWGFLAAGDGTATLAGRTLGGPRLPWNSEKSWAGFLAYVVLGGLTAGLLMAFVAGHTLSPFAWGAVFLAALSGAAVESLPSELDDNITAPLIGAGVLACILSIAPFSTEISGIASRLAWGVAINAAVALLAWFIRLVRPSGVWSGFIVGSLIYGFSDFRGYAMLWIFFAAGTLATRLGRKRKEALGKAEPEGGRRGAANVFANVTVPAFLLVASGLSEAPSLFQLAAVAAFATALMDTIGTEIGQAVKSPTVLLPDFKAVPPGTDGAVSIAGTLAGLAAAAAFGLAGAFLFGFDGACAIFVTVAAAFGAMLESLLGRDGASWRVTNGHILNFYNTAAGAFVLSIIVSMAQWRIP